MIDFGILGMNARNLSYIKKFNTKKAIRLADNKVRTKRFLSARGIPVPETYDVIKNHDQLRSYDFSKLPVDDFIIKPVRGSRGRGIYRVKHLGEENNDNYLDKITSFDRIFSKQSLFKNHIYKVSGEIIDDNTFRRYLLDILYGKNSLVGEKDTIMLEELLTPGGGFEPYCRHGLADIRIIVFNLVPVAAMLRVPTEKSDGKANLDRGAIGMGVEVGSGKIYAMYQDGKIYRDTFPDPYDSFPHRTLPFRDDILSFSSQIQYFANLGYLALDWVITDDGPKLLEINARAGLKFQLAAQLPLAKRLRKIEDLKIVTPEKGVEIAKSLFSAHKNQIITQSNVLYLSQHGKMQFIKESEKESIDVIVEVDLAKRHNYLPKELFSYMIDSKNTNVLCGSQGVSFKNLARRVSEKLEKSKIILGRDTVTDYYVKPIHAIFAKVDFINPKNIQKSEMDQIRILDKELHKLGSILNTSRILKPTNFLEQLDIFITKNGDYDPQFTYRRPSAEKLNQVENNLLGLREKYFGTNGLQSRFAILFKEKIDELLLKHGLIVAYKSQKVKAIRKANKLLFGELDDNLLQESQTIFLGKDEQDKTVLGPKLSRRRIFDVVDAYVKSRNMHNVKIVFDPSSFGRMSIRRGKNITITISSDSGFREHELLSTLAHEVDVHIRRYEAGYTTGWRLLQSGTAGYIKDEEGLAILASQEYLPKSYEKRGMYQKYYLLNIAGEKSFSEIVGIIRSLSNRTLMGAFKSALRLKKGLHDTANRGGAVYMKDKIYLDGYTNVTNRIAQGGDKEKLMIGKIKIDDLVYID